ncbi:MAG: hypothetical protein WCJ30_01745, partial [Deltaproteobacteria bacterium]
RESRIRIDRDGHVWHEGEKIAHENLARGLARWLAIDPGTDRYVMRNALDWCFVSVDDAPLVVRTVRPVPDGEGGWKGFDLELSDASVERLDPATLRIDADDVPYCDVRGGTLPARFGRHAAFVLLEHATTHQGGLAAIRRVGRGEGAPRREPAHPGP